VGQPAPAVRQQNAFFSSDHVSSAFSPASSQEKTSAVIVVTVVEASVPVEQPMSNWLQQQRICSSVMPGLRHCRASASKDCSQVIPPGEQLSAGGTAAAGRDLRSSIRRIGSRTQQHTKQLIG
jgi:hypothetical protein